MKIQRIYLAIIACWAVFLLSTSAIAGEKVSFELTRIFYDDAQRTIDYNFSDGKTATSSIPDMTYVSIEEPEYTGPETYVSYHNPTLNFGDYGLGLRFETYPSAQFDLPSKKAVYSIPKPSSEDLAESYKASHAIALGYSMNVGKADLTEDEWFYSVRLQNFTGFDPNTYNEFYFSMLPAYDKNGLDQLLYEGRSAMPYFQMSAKWVTGLYRGKVFDKAFVIRADARRWGTDGDGEILWSSDVGHTLNPAAEIPTTVAPGNTILDIGAKVEKNDALQRSEVKLYYRMYSSTDSIPSGMNYDGTWTIFHTIPIPYVLFTKEDTSTMLVKFPGFPIALSSYSAHSEAIAFPPELACQSASKRVPASACKRVPLGVKKISCFVKCL